MEMDLSSLPTSFGPQQSHRRSRQSADSESRRAPKRQRHFYAEGAALKFRSDGSFLEQFCSLNCTVAVVPEQSTSGGAAASAVASQPLPFRLGKVVAPMVGQCDLAFRLLCRRHGADLVYTQMLDADRLVHDPDYRQKMFIDDLALHGTCSSADPSAADSVPAERLPEPQRETDRPLVLQLSGNDPATLAKACVLAEKSGALDAIDLNLGCPQQVSSSKCVVPRHVRRVFSGRRYRISHS
jgi:hypothetical protein